MMENAMEPMSANTAVERSFISCMATNLANKKPSGSRSHRLKIIIKMMHSTQKIAAAEY
jgi:hypothetical protein